MTGGRDAFHGVDVRAYPVVRRPSELRRIGGSRVRGDGLCRIVEHTAAGTDLKPPGVTIRGFRGRQDPFARDWMSDIFAPRTDTGHRVIAEQGDAPAIITDCGGCKGSPFQDGSEVSRYHMTHDADIYRTIDSQMAEQVRDLPGGTPVEIGGMRYESAGWVRWRLGLPDGGNGRHVAGDTSAEGRRTILGPSGDRGRVRRDDPHGRRERAARARGGRVGSNGRSGAEIVDVDPGSYLAATAGRHARAASSHGCVCARRPATVRCPPEVSTRRGEPVSARHATCWIGPCSTALPRRSRSSRRGVGCRRSINARLRSSAQFGNGG